MMHKEYSDSFTLSRQPSVMLKDYCRGCWQCRLEAVDTQISGDTVTVPMLMCKFRAGCELQRRMISTEPQRRANEQAEIADETRKPARERAGNEPIGARDDARVQQSTG